MEKEEKKTLMSNSITIYIHNLTQIVSSVNAGKYAYN